MRLTGRNSNTAFFHQSCAVTGHECRLMFAHKRGPFARVPPGTSTRLPVVKPVGTSQVAPCRRFLVYHYDAVDVSLQVLKMAA